MHAKDALGRYGEDVAVRHLLDAGWLVLERNWRCRAGEIDIVARDGGVLVFCEVKTRSSALFGVPAEAVRPAKVRRIRALACHWLADRRREAGAGDSGRGLDSCDLADLSGDVELRFDVLSVLCPSQQATQVEQSTRGVLMPLARTLAVALVGVEGRLVEVEADLAQGLPGLTLVGLPDTSLQEARDRIRAAIVNSGESWPQRRITLGLSPASLPKRGSSFDLAMAIAVLAAAGGVPTALLADTVLVGERGLDGRVRPVRGVLPAVQAELPHQHGVRQQRGWHHTGGRQHRDGHRQIEAAPALGQAGWGQPEGDPSLRPRLAAVDDGGADPVARLLQRGVRQADKRKRGQALGQVGLHLDQSALHPDQGYRQSAGQRH